MTDYADMAQKAISPDVIAAIQDFLTEVKKHYAVESLILFGSHANGSNTSDSDIDLAVVSHDFTDHYDDMARLMKLTWNIDTRIEPHPVTSDEYRAVSTPFIDEIVSTGLKVA